MARTVPARLPNFLRHIYREKYTHGQRSTSRLRAPERLEDRRMLAADTYVNDNWHLVEDNGDNVISVGDIVDNRTDNGGTANLSKVYGTTAFGTITSQEAGEVTTPLPGSIAAADRINDAIAATDLGGTVHVLAGAYTESVTVDRRVKLIGAGSGATANDTIIDADGGVGITIAASGTTAAAADRVVVEDLRVQNHTNGFYFDSTVAHITLRDVAAVNAAKTGVGIEVHNAADIEDLALVNVTLSGNNLGFSVATTGSVAGLDVQTSTFDGNNYGLYVEAENNAATANEDAFTDITFVDTSFSNNSLKGIYAEKLDEALFDDITVASSGTSGGFAAGIDINLKYGDYVNIAIEDSSITNSGTGDVVNGAGIAIKARSDAPSYNTIPATLAGVSITNTTITGNQVGIRLGEPGKNNTGPTGVVLDATFSGNILQDIDNQTTVQVDARDSTFTGAADGFDIEDRIRHKLDNAALGLVVFQQGHVYVTTASGSIQRGVNAASAGNTVNVDAGTFTETVAVDKSVTLRGARFGIDARVRSVTATSETVVNGPAGAFNITANNVVVDGFTVQGTVNDTVRGAGIFTSETASGYKIRNNIIHDNTAGLIFRASGVTQSVVERNLFRDNNNTGSADGFGIYSDLNHLANALIQDNRFAGDHFSAGVSLAGVDNVTLEDNVFVDGNQLRLFDADDSKVISNDFSGSLLVAANTDTAVFVGGGSNLLVIAENTFTNRGAGAIIVYDGGFGSGVNSNVKIAENTINQNVAQLKGGLAMIDLRGVQGTAEVSENRVNLTGAVNGTVTFVNALEISGAGTGTVNVLRNEFDGGDVDAPNGNNDSAAIRLLSTIGTATVNIQANRLNEFVHGVSSQALAANANVNVNGNDLSDNSGKGVLNAGTVLIDASLNWWGIKSTAGVRARANAGTAVDYTPWLNSGSDTDDGDVGFAGNFSVLHVDDASLQAETNEAVPRSFNRLREGLDLVSTGGRVIVHGGTYGNTTISDKITLEGDFDLDGSLTVNRKDAFFNPSGNSTAVFNVGDTAFNFRRSGLIVDLNGSTAGTGYDQLNVDGTVTLKFSELDVKLGFDPSLNQQFTIINNDGTDAIIGRFRYLTDEEVFSVDGQSFRIDYNGGDGNDVVLTAVAASEIVKTQFSADGFTNLVITYTITGQTASSPFKINFYRSADSRFSNSDVLLDSVRISAAADLTVGEHVKIYTIGAGGNDFVSLPGAGAAEVNRDYRLLAVTDPENDIFRGSNDGTAVFEGIYHAEDGSVFVHARDKFDRVRIKGNEDKFTLLYHGGKFTYDDVMDFRVRAHAGNDEIDASLVEDVPLFAWGGSGDDEILGGSEGDYLDGGPGNNVLRGAGGPDEYVEADSSNPLRRSASDAYFASLAEEPQVSARRARTRLAPI